VSSLEDVDYNKVLSDLARQQLQLQVAQKTFTQISNLSIFNYIK
jgi:flagellar hook-associated protein 3 FlgL